MFRRKAYASARVLFAVAVLLFASVSPVAAATTNTNAGAGNGLRISPVRTDLTINPGNSQTIDVYVTNLTKEDAVLQGVVDDFTAGTDESGNPAILLNGEKAPSHSLKDYVSSIGTFSLAGQATKDLKVTIAIPKGVAGGGYFGAVRIVPAPSNANKNVNLTASVGSLILVTVPGPVNEQMSLASFDVRHINPKTNAVESPSVLFTSNKNIAGVVRFQNSGNLQEEPFGKMILKKGSKTIATYDVNNTSPRGNVLPSSIRRFAVPLSGMGSFGKYTLEGNFGYGTKGQLLSASTSFYIVPLTAIVIAVVVLLLILVVVYLIRAYIKEAIKKATSRGNK